MSNEWFLNPSAEYRIHPFWFWNGDMNDETIQYQIREMADKGVGGFFICARQGLSVPYLSEEWFDKVRLAVQIAEQFGLHVWLYDEFPYPSGIAGGEVVLEHPEAKHYSLEYQTFKVLGGQKISLELPWGRIVQLAGVPLTETGVRSWDQSVNLRPFVGSSQLNPIFRRWGLTAYNQKRFFTNRLVYKLVWDVPPGEWEVILFQEKEIENFKYYGSYVDPCNPEAVETFIRMTHDRYAEVAGEYFGSTIKGMFTDEVSMLGRFPWSPKLESFFEEMNGYSLTDRLPALLYEEAAEAAKFRYDYYQAAHTLLCETYHSKVSEWCEQHDLEYITEVPCLRMTTHKYSHIPGGDSAHEKLGRSLDWSLKKNAAEMRSNPKMISSLARQLSRKRNLIECFHSIGWSMTLQDAKWMIDRMSVMGTNFFNFHAFFYSLEGLRKHDAPPSQFLQNPYWRHFRKLADYAGRISSLMSRGKAYIRTALIDPTTSLWTHLGHPYHSFKYIGNDPAEEKRLNRLKNDWVEIAAYLLKTRRDYDHLDTELLADADIRGGRMILGVAEYDTLILPPVANLEQKAWQRLKDFLEQGGTVIGMGQLPNEKIAKDSPDEDEVVEMFGVMNRDAALSPWCKGEKNAFFLPFGGDTAEEALPRFEPLLEQWLAAPVRLVADLGANSFLMQTRIMPDGNIAVFVSNQEAQRHYGLFELDPVELWGAGEIPGAVTFEEWDLETGDTRPLAAEATNCRRTVALEWAPYQSRLIMISQGISATITPAKQRYKLEIPISGRWRIKAYNDNTMRFGKFHLQLEKEDRTSNPHEIEVEAKPFINQWEELSKEIGLPFETERVFGKPMQIGMSYPIQCFYKTDFLVESMPEKCHLFMDRSAVSGNCVLLVNGNAVTGEQFQPFPIYDADNVACDVLMFLKTGLNKLEARIEIINDEDGISDPLYLHGPFGVSFNNQGTPIMTKLPDLAGDLTAIRRFGFPYFAGMISFQQSMDIDEMPETEEFSISFKDGDKQFHDCMEVWVNGHFLGVRPWTPYEWQGASHILKAGSNNVEVRITNTLIGLLEGEYFDHDAHCLKSVSKGIKRI